MKKLLSIFLIAAFIVSTLSVNVYATSKTQEEAVKWVKDQKGKPSYALSAGSTNKTCTAFVKAYYDYLDAPLNAVTAKNFATSTNVLPKELGWTRIQYSEKPEAQPQPGDIAIWTTYYSDDRGHVAVVISADKVNINIVNQLASDSDDEKNGLRQATIKSATVPYKKTGCVFWGVIRPNFSSTKTSSNTLTPLTVTTLAAKNITTNNAVIQAKISGARVSSGYLFGTSESTVKALTADKAERTKNGIWWNLTQSKESTITYDFKNEKDAPAKPPLAAGGTYYYKAFAKRADGTYEYGNTMPLKLTQPTPVNSSYTVTFNPNGGNVSQTSKAVTKGSTYGTLPTPTRSDHEFKGWYTASSGGTKITSTTTVNISANQTLYAQWQKIPVTQAPPQPPKLPTVKAGPAVNITASSATCTAVISNPSGQKIDIVIFSVFGGDGKEKKEVVSDTYRGDTSKSVKIEYRLSNLQADKSYDTYFNLIMVDGNLVTGACSFKTLKNQPSPRLPVITTLSASNITQTNAVLNAKVTGNVRSSGFYYGISRSDVENLRSAKKEFGVVTNYEHTVTCNMNSEAGVMLSPGTAYYYKAVTYDANGKLYEGEVMQFTTQAASTTYAFNQIIWDTSSVIASTTLMSGNTYEIENIGSSAVKIKNDSNKERRFDWVWYAWDTNAKGNYVAASWENAYNDEFTLNVNHKYRITIKSNDVRMTTPTDSVNSIKIKATEIPALFYFTLEAGKTYEIKNNGSSAVQINNNSNKDRCFDWVWYAWNTNANSSYIASTWENAYNDKPTLNVNHKYLITVKAYDINCYVPYEQAAFLSGIPK